ncbi:MAG: hypothetical protein MHM6MM_000118 [Cercozoa sp. M6MM]
MLRLLVLGAVLGSVLVQADSGARLEAVQAKLQQNDPASLDDAAAELREVAAELKAREAAFESRVNERVRQIRAESGDANLFERLQLGVSALLDRISQVTASDVQAFVTTRVPAFFVHDVPRLAEEMKVREHAQKFVAEAGERVGQAVQFVKEVDYKGIAENLAVHVDRAADQTLARMRSLGPQGEMVADTVAQVDLTVQSKLQSVLPSKHVSAVSRVSLLVTVLVVLVSTLAILRGLCAPSSKSSKSATKKNKSKGKKPATRQPAVGNAPTQTMTPSSSKNKKKKKKNSSSKKK